MTVDCQQTLATAKGRATAKRLHLCGQSTGGVQPNNTVYGACGSTTLTLSDGGAGEVNFYEDAISNSGTIDYVAYNVGWTNFTTGVGGNASGTGSSPSTYWYHNDHIYTGHGYISASMSGQATLSNGLQCVFGDANGNLASDSITV